MKNLEDSGAVVLDVMSQNENYISDDVVKIIIELVDHNEIGVALDTLCSQLFECGIEISKENKNKIKNVAFLLGIPLSKLDGFSDWRNANSLWVEAAIALDDNSAALVLCPVCATDYLHVKDNRCADVVEREIRCPSCGAHTYSRLLRPLYS